MMIAAEPAHLKFSGHELWLVDLSAAGSALDAIEAQTPRLSVGQERSFAQSKLPNAATDKRRSHIALRLLLERAFATDERCRPFEVKAGGKPILNVDTANASPGPACDFSLSHAGGFALIGMTEAGQIGVDIEVQRTLRMPPARQVKIVAAAERLGNMDEALAPSGDNLNALQAWVRLEAFAKMDGAGIGWLLTELGVVGGDKRDETGAVVPVDRQMAEMITAHAGLAVSDIDVGESRFAAVAMQTQIATHSCLPSLHRFPCAIDDMAALADPL